MNLFIETPDWVRPTEFPRLKGLVGLDFETVDPDIKIRGSSWAFSGRGKVIGIGVTNGDGKEYYYPVGHEMGNMDDVPKVWEWLKHELETNPDDSLEVLVFNWLYEMGWLLRYGIRPKCPVYDPGVAMSLIDECRILYSLNSVAQTILGEGKYSDNLRNLAEGFGIKDHMSQLDKLPPMYVGPYCQQDASLLQPLWTKLQDQIQRRNLVSIQKLEHNVLPVVLDMRWRGLRINESRLASRLEEYEAQEKDILAEIKRHVGRDVEMWAQDSIADAMDLLGIDYPKTNAGNPSFTADWLSSHEHDVPKLIVKARQYNKVRGTFLQSYFADNIHKGRLHPTFTPLRSDEGGAVTGRFSSSDPNMQNLPARTGEFAAAVRGLVMPEDGDLWAALDYSSQEPRLTVHYAALANCPGADKAVDEYMSNPKTDYHQFVADTTGLSRKDSKEINLGLPYGMGGAKLCKLKLKLPTRWAIFNRNSNTLYFDNQEDAWEYHKENNSRQPIEVAGEEGQQFLDTYHERLPYIKDLMKKTETRAKNKGFITTILGRQRHFLMSDEKVTKYNRKKAFPYKALNSLIQGSAADMIKKAMIDLHQNGFTLLTTVHDENGLSVCDEKKAKEAAEIMENAVPLKVPNIVDVECGESWAASMGLPVKD